MFISAGNIIHLLNLMLPKDAICIEVGVGRGINFCGLLESCPKIKTLYGVDQFKPYTDYLTHEYSMDNPALIIDEERIKKISEINKENIKNSINGHKSIMIEKSSIDAAKDFEDETFDFVFLDSYLTKEDVFHDLRSWYPKVKNGGIFAGHDFHFNPVKEEFYNFIEEKRIKERVSVYDEIWCLIK